MMTGVDFLLSVAASLIATAVDRALIEEPGKWQRRRICRRIDSITDGIIRPIAEYFDQEGIDEKTTRLIAKEAEEQVRSLIANSDKIIARGLDVNAIASDILTEMRVNNVKTIAEEYPSAFDIMLRAYVDLAVRTPPLFADWEQKQFATTYKKLEELETYLSKMYEDMRKVAERHERGESLIDRIIVHQAGQLALKMSMHGLRSSELPQTDIDNLFILPHFSKLTLIKKNLREPERLNEDQYNNYFSPGKTGLRCVVVAPAGAGKTTWTDWLGAQLLNAKQKTALPVIIRLRLALKNKNLPTIKEATLSAISPAFHDKFGSHEIESWARDGKLTLILDGFDEVPEHDRNNVWNWTSSLEAADPSINIIITTRPLTTNHIQTFEKNGFQYLALEPFDENQVEAYIEKYKEYGPPIQTGAPEVSAKELAHTWRQDPSLGPLTANPLLLSTLLAVHHMDGELPRGRTALYERYVDGLLGAWENRKELTPPDIALTKLAKRRILELIAINMIAKEVDAVDEKEAAKWINQFLEEIGVEAPVLNVLENLRERSGLLIGPGQYSFAHKSIGEFLVACACHDGIARDINGQRYDRMLITQSCHDDRWRMVVFLWAGLAPATDIQRLLDDLIGTGELGIAAGLLNEQGERLDQDRRAAICWKLITRLNDIQLSDKQPDEGYINVNYMSIPIADASLNHKSMSLPFSITTDFMYDPDYFERNWINAHDWNQHIKRLSPYTFLKLCNELGFDKNIAEHTIPPVTHEEHAAWLTFRHLIVKDHDKSVSLEALIEMFKNSPDGVWRGIAMFAVLAAELSIIDDPANTDFISYILESENSNPSKTVCIDLIVLEYVDNHTWSKMIAKFLKKRKATGDEPSPLISAVKNVDACCKAIKGNAA